MLMDGIDVRIGEIAPRERLIYTPGTTPMRSAPRIEIVSTGTEILQGMYADTNAQWMSQRLLEIGLPVSAHSAVGDSREDLTALLRGGVDRCDLFIVSGGLGPTEDDVNRDAFADVYGRNLVEDEAAVEQMRRHFASRSRPFRESNRIQAMIPEGARTLYNDWGTAPGFVLEGDADRRATLIALPGPPREMRPMFERWVEPYLLERFRPSDRLLTLTIHTVNLPESDINAHIHDLFNADPAVNVASLAKTGKVDIRLTARCDSDDKALRVLETFRGRIEERVGPENVYGVDDDTIESAVGRLLVERQMTIAVAESCTGGMLASRLTGVAGASSYLLEGFVTYSNEAKTARLGVPPELIVRHGAVSAEVARAMAEGVRRAAKTDLGISTTGIAGPTGGTPEKPVGLVYIGLAWDGDAMAVEHRFLGNRDENRIYSTHCALDLVRRHLLRRRDG